MKGVATSHRLKWGPLPQNDISRIAQHVRKIEGRKDGKDEKGFFVPIIINIDCFCKKCDVRLNVKTVKFA